VTTADLDLDIMLDERDFGCRCIRCSTTRLEGNIPLWDDDPGERILLLNQHKLWLRDRELKRAQLGTALLGTRTAADLKYGPPPQPLLPPFFTTESALVLYGPGGAGKGTMASYLAIEYLRLDPENTVMVLDFEGHETEWGNRLRGLGATEEELQRIHYREPFGADWGIGENTIALAADVIKRDANGLGVGLLIVDSIVMASDGDAAMGGAAAAKAYFAGLATIGLRSLNLGHVAGAAEKWPAKPFGSTYVHNLARETWAIEQVPGDDEPFVPSTDGAITARNSSGFRVELRNRKNSEGAVQPPAIFDVTYYSNGDLTVTPVAKEAKLPKDLVVDVLRGSTGMTVAAIVAAIKEDTGDAITTKAVTNALTRNPKVFAHDDKRPRKWVLV
jgi:hypothetical protein